GLPHAERGAATQGPRASGTTAHGDAPSAAAGVLADAVHRAWPPGSGAAFSAPASGTSRRIGSIGTVALLVGSAALPHVCRRSPLARIPSRELPGEGAARSSPGRALDLVAA